MRVVQDLVGEAGFHDLAALHDDDAVRQQAGDGEVVRDEDDGDAEAACAYAGRPQ